jgi:hypothetical protein
VLKAVQLPARVGDLATCLSHCEVKKSVVGRARLNTNKSRVNTYR